VLPAHAGPSSTRRAAARGAAGGGTHRELRKRPAAARDPAMSEGAVAVPGDSLAMRELTNCGVE
jgi:hypothetical protein